MASDAQLRNPKEADDLSDCGPLLPADPGDNSPWIILSIDDDDDVNKLTRLVLRDLTFQGRGVTVLAGRSGAEAIELMTRHPETAVVLLDVVMETDRAGLDVVRRIREELHNPHVRIILRTGQAGQAPELQVIAEYDINDYREKTDLTSQKLISAVTGALRGFRDLQTIRDLARRLRSERQSLARAQAIARLGNWEWDIPGNRISWSDEIFRIFGLDPETTAISYETFLGSVHPEDRERVRQTVAHCLENATAGYEIEHRVLRPDGGVRHVNEIGEVVRDAFGQPLRMVGTVHDITERKEAEEQLRIATSVFGGAMAEVEEQLTVTAKVFEHAIEGVMITDPEGTIVSVNPAFTAITGFSAEEAIGKTPRILRSDRQGKAFYKQMWREILDNGIWQGELWNRRRNGEAFPLSESITAIRNASGKLINYVSVFHDLTHIKAKEQALHFQTYHDSLTGLPNRDLFQDRLNQALGNALRNTGKVLVLFFDLDSFKNVNNSLGHTAGDQLLQDVSERLRFFIREGDTLARLGSDTFAIILREIKQPQDALTVVRKLTGALSEAFVIADQKLFVTSSIGITLYPDDGDNAQTLIKNADIALARAKKAGRNNFQYYMPDMGLQANQRMVLERNLRLGLERGEFILHYQPRVDIGSGTVIGMEALVRWNHPETGLVSPGEFIPVAEETGLIIPMGQWILETACRQARQWIDAGHGQLRVSVNLSARQFRQENLLEVIEATLRDTGLPPDNLELEITESIVMDHVDKAIAILERLRGLGLHIAVDDFGTGYSSLNYLKRFPINTLKIDQSFVRDLTRDSDDAAIISAIIALARNMRLSVVAEGVETREQLAFLREEACDELQGYYFSRPLDADAFGKLLQEKRRLIY